MQVLRYKRSHYHYFDYQSDVIETGGSFEYTRSCGIYASDPDPVGDIVVYEHGSLN